MTAQTTGDRENRNTHFKKEMLHQSPAVLGLYQQNSEWKWQPTRSLSHWNQKPRHHPWPHLSSPFLSSCLDYRTGSHICCYLAHSCQNNLLKCKRMSLCCALHGSHCTGQTFYTSHQGPHQSLWRMLYCYLKNFKQLYDVFVHCSSSLD